MTRPSTASIILLHGAPSRRAFVQNASTCANYAEHRIRARYIISYISSATTSRILRSHSTRITSCSCVVTVTTQCMSAASIEFVVLSSMRSATSRKSGSLLRPRSRLCKTRSFASVSRRQNIRSRSCTSSPHLSAIERTAEDLRPSIPCTFFVLQSRWHKQIPKMYTTHTTKEVCITND